MLNRIKYWLFCKLFGEICEKSVCLNCKFHHGRLCFQNDAYLQARKVWKIE
jgi:hypothetical protein